MAARRETTVLDSPGVPLPALAIAVAVQLLYADVVSHLSHGELRQFVHRVRAAFDATLVQAGQRVAWLLAKATAAGAKS